MRLFPPIAVGRGRRLQVVDWDTATAKAPTSRNVDGTPWHVLASTSEPARHAGVIWLPLPNACGGVTAFERFREMEVRTKK